MSHIRHTRLIQLLPFLLGAPVLAMLTTVVHAGAGDFARGRVVVTADEQARERIVLPQDVYEWTTRADLADVRVLNGAGGELPFYLQPMLPVTSDDPWQDLPLFPIPKASDNGDNLSLRVQLDDGGRIVAIADLRAAEATAEQWLVDAHMWIYRPIELKVRIEDPTGDIVARILVEASDDLEHWQKITGPVAIARLERGGETILRDTIELPETRLRYLRFTTVDARLPLRLAGIAVRDRGPDPVQHDFKTLAGTLNRDGWEFDAGGHFPIDRVAVSVPGDAYLVSARILSRPTTDDRWRNRGVHRFYRVAAADLLTTSEPARVARSSDRLWRVEWIEPNEASPELAIGWTPRELIFLKQGDPPFLLVYGQAGLAPKQWPAEALVPGNSRPTHPTMLPLATLAEPQLLGGPARLAAPPRQLDWQVVALWAALGLGVGIIVYLAVRIAR